MFKAKEDLLSAIQQAFTNLNNGQFDLNQMNELVENTRELYERSLIIRHKAFELKASQQTVVFEQDIQETIINQPAVEQEINNVVEEISQPIEIFEETIADVEETISAEEIIEEEVPVIENTYVRNSEETFSVTEKDDLFSFDLFASEEKVEETPTQPIFEALETPAPIVQNIEEEKEEEIELPKAIGDIIQANMNEITVESVIEAEQEMEDELVENTPETIETPTAFTAPTTDASFFNSYRSLELNPSAKLIAPKIENLTGAFGLNEKLMFIRELFNGSSDAFNTSIATIDQLGNFNEAKSFLNPIAIENEWTLENQTTVDFIAKIERRFF